MNSLDIPVRVSLIWYHRVHGSLFVWQPQPPLASRAPDLPSART